MLYIQGIEIVFKIALAYLTISQDELLKMDMESMLRVFFYTLIYYYLNI